MATLKDIQISEQYDRSQATSLYEVYGRHSRAKDLAWDNCRILCYEYRGHGLKIISHNTSFFTAAFLYDGEGGKPMLMRITYAGHHPHEYTGREY